jgi:hypothetical protein
MLIAAVLMLILGLPTLLYCTKAVSEIKKPKILNESGIEVKNSPIALVSHYFYMAFGIAITLGGLISLISYFEEFIPEIYFSTPSQTNYYNAETTDRADLIVIQRPKV